MKTIDNLQNKSQKELVDIARSLQAEIQNIQETLQNKIILKDKKINHLQEKLKAYIAQRYGRKSEKMSQGPQSELFDEAENLVFDNTFEDEAQEITVPAHTRKKKTGRKPLPEYLDHIRKEYE